MISMDPTILRYKNNVGEHRFKVNSVNTIVECSMGNNFIGNVNATLVKLGKSISIHITGNLNLSIPSQNVITMNFPNDWIGSDWLPKTTWSKTFIFNTDEQNNVYGKITSVPHYGQFNINSDMDDGTFYIYPDKVYIDTFVFFTNK